MLAAAPRYIKTAKQVRQHRDGRDDDCRSSGGTVLSLRAEGAADESEWNVSGIT